MKKLMLPLIAVLVGGCATTPWTEKPGDVCDFEFPFVNDIPHNEWLIDDLF